MVRALSIRFSALGPFGANPATLWLKYLDEWRNCAPRIVDDEDAARLLVICMVLHCLRNRHWERCEYASFALV